MRRYRLPAAFGFALVLASATAAEPLAPIDLWPGAVPGEKGDIPPEEAGDPKTKAKTPVRQVTNVSKPTITVYRPAKEVDTGAAIVVAPGGGYRVLAWEHEGTQFAEWLQTIGVTGIVLKYRVPRRPGTSADQSPAWALQDAERAISLVRSRAAEWGLHKHRIGMLGFSAGGHLTAWTATNPDKRAYEPIEEADKEGCRPDFAVMIYPGGLVDKEKKDQLRPEIRVSKETPPCFFALAYNDAGPLDGTLKMMEALQRAKVPAELHVYAAGGHGFGMRQTDKPHATWPKRCEEWMRAEGFLASKK